MGAPNGCLVLAWVLAALLLVQETDTQSSVEPSQPSRQAAEHSRRVDVAWSMTVIPPITVLPTMSSWNPAHNGRVCSTWGDFHYKTFDGDVFRFPGLCNYVLSAHCGAAYEDFNVQLRRGLAGSRPTITHVVLKTQGLVLEASNGSVLINGRREELPYSRAGLLVEQSSVYIKVTVRPLLTFMWNGEDSALLELDPKYANQTCGLCGDFNGLPAVNEFYSHNARLTPLQFGNLQKLDGPTEQCQDPPSSLAGNCTDVEGVCRRTLLGPAFAECNKLVDPTAYVAACTQDLCRCPTCPCATFVEYSRQCAHAGGQPQDWRGPDLCPQTCPPSMQHRECGSPCADTCSNPQRSQLCEDHCMDGCFCPPGTVLDDVTHQGCLALEQCPCTHGGHTYAPGASFTSSCSTCTCSGGLWQCQDLPCPGTCSVQGGSHISTYDQRLYDVHGDCSYVLSKTCAGSSFSVLAELRRCGLTDNENCLKSVALSVNGGDTVIQIQANGGVFVNAIFTQLPVSAANVTVFRPTSFFVLAHTGFGLQLHVQLVPLMQVLLRLDPSYHGRMCGLCGNFNQNQADDFRTLSGVVEGTAAAFANTWKTQAACPNVKNSFEDPCSLSVENENYAQHWCSLLTDPAGAFSRCHSVLNPAPFHSNCMFDTCNCEKSEDCLCAALSSYVHACAAKGVLLSGWRDGVCTKYVSSCPQSQNYSYVVDSCQPTCRARSQVDVTCSVPFLPVDGCICPVGTFLDDSGACVSADACPCYFRGSVLAPGEVVHDDGVVCSCVAGRLSCLGAAEQRSSGCVAPMVYLDCSNASAGAPGAECLRSCHTLDVDCFSTHCVSGCVCPLGLVSDGSGGCVAEEDCPCLHNEAVYKPGDTIRVDCNTCTCRNRRWVCSHEPCLGTCVAYGDGHFITFDGERYGFEGTCEYTLVQDYCGGNGTTNGTFRVVTENVPCGTTGVTCSKAIKLFLESYELVLQDGGYRAVQRGPGGEPPYKVRHTGNYLTVETRGGLVLSWDRRTSVFVRLKQDYKGRVCGLCGNFDDNAVNDFTTRSQSVVGSALEFGNSWKFSPSCPDAPAPRDPCTANPYRKSWAQKQCSIINSATFATCHPQVDPAKYYEACVGDACACDSGGDCECFCTAVAAYAQACRDVGVCVSWRTPDTCPLFCDYYNPEGQCEWHYQPCGAPCMRTCRNPGGRCLHDLPGLEGCYPRCPPSEPFFSEDQMKCVAQCGCYDEDGNYHDVGTRVPTAENCQSCECTAGGLQCTHSLTACTCVYEGRIYHYEDVIYNTTDGLGACLVAICGQNGTILRRAVECPGTLSTVPFTFTTTVVPLSTTGSVPTVTTVCVHEFCLWSDWYDSGPPEPGMAGGDFETFVNLRQRGYEVCLAPVSVECRARRLPDTPLLQLGQKVECDVARGLTCFNSEQSPPLCHDYELRVLCCSYLPCGSSPGATTTALGTTTSPGATTTSSGTTTTAPGATTTPGVTTTSPGTTTMAPGATTTSPGTTTMVPGATTYPRATTRQPPARSAPATETPPAETTVTGTRASSSPPALASTSCQPRCQWTEWFDEDYPKSEEAGGDVESYDKIRSAGGAVCEQPVDIECQAENFPGRSAKELGQRVHCDASFGLVCRNEEQAGLFKMCYNYRIRVLCCRQDHCAEPTPGTQTPATAQTTGGPSRGTPQTHTIPTATGVEATTGTVPAGPLSSPRTEMHTTTARTSPGTLGTATTAATPSQSTAGCQPQCEWTDWFDMDFPTSGVEGGDLETLDNIRAAGGALCEEPQKIECRAENYPEVSIDQIGQVLSCDLHTGLVCKNQDQKGPFNMCFNYNIRVLCCHPNPHCPSTPAPGGSTSLGQEATTTASTQTYASSPGTTHGVSVSTTQILPSLVRTTERVSSPGPSASPGTPTTTTTKPTSPRAPTMVPKVTPSPWTSPGSPPSTATFGTTLLSTPLPPSSTSHTLATSSSTGCSPRCTWTDWFDEDYPTPGLDGGDFETFSVFRSAGHDFCQRPQDIQCRSERAPHARLEDLGQVVQCNVSFGLVCRNREQPGPLHYCDNYHVRVLCCEDDGRCASPTAPEPTTPSPGTPTTRATTAFRSAPVIRISTASTVSPHGSESPPWQPETSPGLPGVMPSTGAGPRASLSPPVPETTSSMPGTTLGLSTAASRATVPVGKNETSLPVTSSHTQTPMSPVARSTACEPRCAWTDWLDESYPVPGASGGDFETYANLRAAGKAICQRPRALQCRAEAQPETPLQELGQAVRCGLEDGLVCRNEDQAGPFHMCLNYQVRVLCCEDDGRCASTVATTALSSRSTGPGPTPVLPTSTMVPSPPAPSTGRTTATTTCLPTCHWTDWLDSDQPRPGRYGGDIETYYHIQDAGGQLCAEPEAIECQAVLYPDVPWGQLGQDVRCDPSYGLICRNNWQTGGHTCLNYRVRVLCCESPSRCATQPTTEPAAASSSSTRLRSSGVTGLQTTAIHPSSPETTLGVTGPTSQAGPSSPGTTHGVPVSTTQISPSSPRTTQTGPSSPGTTHGVPVSTTLISPSSPRTTQTGPSSPGTTHGVPVSTTQISPSSPRTTQTGPSSPGTTHGVPVSTTLISPSSPRTTQTGPSSPGTTHGVPVSTTQISPSSPRTTQTGPSSPGTTHGVPVSTTQMLPSSRRTTQTGPSSPGTTHGVPVSTTLISPSSPRTTQTGPSSPGTTHGVPVSTTLISPSSPRTTQTGPSSPGTTHGVPVSTTLISPSSPRTTQTGPSSPGTTHGVSVSTTQISPSSPRTTQTVPSSPGTTHGVPVSTTLISPSSPRTTQTGPSSPGTTHGVPVSTTLISPSSPRTTKTGPSSPGTTHGVSVSTTQISLSSPRTTQTGPSSPGTTHGVPVSTTQISPSSPRTTQTGPSSPGTTHGVPVSTPSTSIGQTSSGVLRLRTTTTHPTSPETTQRYSVPTTQILPSSPRTTQTGPSSPGTTHGVPVSTTLISPSFPRATQTGPSSPGSTHGVPVSTTQMLPSSRRTTQTGPSSPGTTHGVPVSTTQISPSSPRTTKTGPSSPGTTHGVPVSITQISPSSPRTTQTGPSSPGTTHGVPVSTTLISPSSPRTTQTGPSSPGTTHVVPVSTTQISPSSPRTTQTGPSSPGTTHVVPVSTTQISPSSPRTTQTGPSSPGTTHGVPVSTTQMLPSSRTTTQTGPSSTGTTQGVSVSTTQISASSPRTTQTGPSSPGTTHGVSVSTTQISPSSPRTTQTVPSSPGTTHGVPVSTTLISPSSPRTTQTGPSSPGTTHGVPVSTTLISPSSPRTTQTGPSSPGTTHGVSVSTTQISPSSPRTTQTGPSSPGTTHGVPVSTTQISPSSPRTTQTGPSSPGTTHGVPMSTPSTSIGQTSSGILRLRTTTTHPTSPETTQRYTVPTTQTLPSSPRTTQTGPSSPGTTHGVSVSTTQISPSSPRTTQTGPSSPGTTQGVSVSITQISPSSPRTTQTGPSSPGTTHGVSVSTTQISPSSPRTTQTGPSSPGTTHGVPVSTNQISPSSPRATQTGPSSTGTTQGVPVSTTLISPSSPRTTQTGPSSPGTTHGVPVSTPSTSIGQTSSGVLRLRTTTTHPTSPETTQRYTVPTTQTLPSSPRTTQTGPSSPGTTHGVPVSTTQISPSSPRTIQTGPSSPGTTHGVPVSTTQMLPSSFRTTQTGPSSPGTTQGVSVSITQISPSSPRTTQTGPSSPGTTHGVSVSTTQISPSSPRATQTGPSSPGTTHGVPVSTTQISASSPRTTQTGPSSPGTTHGVSVSTTQILPSPVRTTERVSSPGPSASPGTPTTTTTKPTSPRAPTTVPEVTPSPWTSPGSPPSTATFGTTLLSTPLPPSSTSHTLATSSSTGCSPRCTWTDWFDEDYPIPGLDGGDFETFSVFRSAGHDFCQRPQDIQCRSERAPHARLEDLGQVVQCNVSFGLVCRNREQPGPLHYCDNYHVRVLCCEDDGRCASPTAPEPTTPSPGTPVPETTSSPPSTTLGFSTAASRASAPHTLPPVTVSTPSTSILTTLGPPVSPSRNLTTRCLCRALGQLFSPGEVIYNKTDSAGCSFYAVCNQHCDIDRFQDACPTSSPPEASSTPVASPSQPEGCNLIIPPRQVNESWTLPDCTVARCEGHNRVVLLGQKPVASIHCVNGHPPVRVSQDNEPCDFHFECECSCSGWGGSHYTTFDGTSYSFEDNCTHVLMKEIRPRYGNLSISMNSYYCGAAAAPATCPRALSVHYKSMEVILTTRTGTRGQEQSLILFGQMQVGSGFSKDGVRVSVTGGTTMSIDIPAAGVNVTFDGQVFHIQLSYSRFSHNTEGQCGTCTNSQTDDCRRPDGTMAATCQDMAHHWLVPESGQEGCSVPTRRPPTARTSPSAPITPASSPCPPTPLCELLRSPLFAECRALIPPDPFVSSCVSDSCRADGPQAPCRSLEAYAALCRARGVCSDWRNATNGLCDFTCPPDKVYQPCGPAQPASCDSRSQSGAGKGLAEGCFCPDGLTLFNTHTDICVRACACVGPDGFPKSPGERWVSNCQACLCHEGSMSVQCAPLLCEPQERPPQCERAGFVTETRPLADNSCCLEMLCVCNTTTCPQSSPRCGPGEELTRTQEEGDCCPTFTCRPLLCYYNQTAFGIGATFPSVTPCHTCTCLSGDTQGPIVQCEEDTCNTTCPQGSEYRKVDGRCCGDCVQTACPTEDGQLVQPNETWVNSLVDNCTEYRCEVRNGLPVLVGRATPCANVSSCQGILRKTGCCFSCEEVDKCQVHVNRTILTHQGCATQAPVNVTFCGGSCPGLSKYSVEAQAMERQCTCCQETGVHEEVVTLRCPDGTAIRRTYTHVDKCSCAPACVRSPEAPEDSTPILLT